MKLATTLLIVLSTTGCKRTQVDGAQAAGGEDSEQLTATQTLGKKLGAYIECLNGFTKDVYQGRHTWLDQFKDKGPDPKQASRGPWYGPLALHDPKECRDGIAAAKAMAPKLPDLEAAGDAYVAALVELQPLTVQLRDYFDQGDYKDDKLARAIEAHPKLLAAYGKFMPADRALGTEVDKIEDKLAVDQLAELEKTEGKRLRWHHKRAIAEAKKVVGFATSVNSPFDIEDTTALQAALASFDLAVGELVAYYGANKTEIEKHSFYRQIDGELKTFLKDAKDMLRRNRDKTPFSTGEKATIGANNAASVEGHPSRVIASYNSLIDRSNWSKF